MKNDCEAFCKSLKLKNVFQLPRFYYFELAEDIAAAYAAVTEILRRKVFRIFFCFVLFIRSIISTPITFAIVPPYRIESALYRARSKSLYRYNNIITYFYLYIKLS